MTAETLEKLINKGQAPAVLDVRTAMEYNSGHIPGAIHAPMSKLFQAANEAAPDKNSPLVLVCEHGPRAQLSLGLLKLRGYRQTALLSGHMYKWRQEGRPLK